MTLLPKNEHKELFPVIEQLQNQNKKLRDLAENLLNRMKDIDPEYVEIVNKNFWDLLHK